MISDIWRHIPGDASDILHRHIDDQLPVNRSEKRFFVQWNVVDIVEEIIISKVVEDWRRWIICARVVNQSGSSVEWIDRVWYETLVDEQHIGILEIKNGVILVCGVFGSHQERLSLSRSDSNILTASSSNDRHSVYTVDLYSGLIVTIKDPTMTGESSRADDTDQICRARLDMNRDILCRVDQSSSYWIRSTIFSLTSSRLVLMDYIRHLIVIPVRERDDEFFVILIGRVRIANDEWSPEAIRVLTHVVRVPPVSACLVGLSMSCQ